jgi:hypothetical protein
MGKESLRKVNRKNPFGYGLVTWVVLVIIAIINGTIRNFWYKPIFGDLVAHQISTFTFIAALIIVTHGFLSLLKVKYGSMQLWLLGLMWVGLTVLFEFGFGHYVMGNSWERLLADYNILQGRLWSLVLLATASSPRLVSRFKFWS